MDTKENPPSPNEKSSHIPDSSEQPLFTDEDDPTRFQRIEIRQGSRPGEMRVRIVLPTRPPFRRISTGVLEATREAQMPRSGLGRVFNFIKRMLIGPPLASALMERERLTKFKALVVLASNPISSVAYATEAILVTLIAAGSANLGLTLALSFALVLLLCIVTFSYHQLIRAYPAGGGSYVVALGLLARFAVTRGQPLDPAEE